MRLTKKNLFEDISIGSLYSVCGFFNGFHATAGGPDIPLPQKGF
ncbi:MAG: hypothetical protein ACXWMI_08060 [Syntrophales bacterium]